MDLRHVGTIARREYLTRLKTKSFWLGTLLVPVFMAAWLVIPVLMQSIPRPRLTLAVVDLTGRLAEPLQAELEANLEEKRGGTRFSLELIEPMPTQGLRELRRALNARILDGEIQAWLWIPEDVLDAENPAAEYHAASVSNVMTQASLRGALSRIAREQRLVAAGYDSGALGFLTRGLELEAFRITRDGSRAEGGTTAVILPFVLMALLYTTILMYGTQVMNGVLEEKTSRIVEVMLATASSTELMAGKLIGICAIGLTQLGIWIASAVVVTVPGLLTGLAALPVEVTLPTLSPALIIHFIVLFLLGFFLYASPYAIIGAAFSSQEEAQQMAGVLIAFVIVPWLLFLPVLNDPDGTLAVVASMIPPMTPMVLMLRIAAKMPPLWQILLAEALLAAACVGAVWLAGRIYRVGILMHGKRPSLKEIARWARYS